jgi:uncharacterized protein
VVNRHGHFVWYELHTTDVESAKAFYTGVMDWGLWDASASGRPYLIFTAGDTTVAGLTALSAEARTAGAKPSWIGYVGVDDVDRTGDRIARLGGTVHVPPTNVANISRFSVFSDPQAARLGLFRWLQPRPDAPGPDTIGCVGWHELLAADSEAALAFYGTLFGWQAGDREVESGNTYVRFAAGADTIGAIDSQLPTMTDPFWLYYFNVGDIDDAAKRVEAGGGEILGGPADVPGGSWAVECRDPQGAVFALEGVRKPRPIGYFERAGPRGPAGGGGRWSW